MIAPDLSTPRRALRHFIDACREGDYEGAAVVFDRRRVRENQRAPVARKLKFVLDQTFWVDYEKISDEPAGGEDGGAGIEPVGLLEYENEKVDLHLKRVWRENEQIWIIPGEVTSRVEPIYELLAPSWIITYIPDQWTGYRFLEMEAWQWGGLIAGFILAFLVGWLAAVIITASSRAFAKKTAIKWDDKFIENASSPLRMFMTLLLMHGISRLLGLSVVSQGVVDRILQTGMIMTVGWFLLRLISFISETVEEEVKDDDPLRARGIRTQVIVLRRVGHILVIILASALILTQFETVRRVGVSLLASAGIAGIVIGLAAQKSIGSLIAGIQLALTQPVRIGDTVIIEGEWGQIEEIHLTYAVVRIWDQRRLVIPISNLLDKPFQNWTRKSSEILGVVKVHADYSVPVDKVRAALTEYVEKHKLWDKRACGLQVTQTDSSTITLRAVVSAANASHSWDLCCDTREYLVEYLQSLDDGKYLPRLRLNQ